MLLFYTTYAKVMQKTLLTIFLRVVPWLIIGGLYLLIRFAGTRESVDWGISIHSLLMIWIFGAILVSLFFHLGGYLAYLSYFRKQPYGIIILLRVAVVFIGLLLLSLLSRFVAFFYGQIEFNEILPSWFQRLSELPTLVVFLYLIIATAVMSFIKQMSFMMGTKVFINLLLGKYRFPRVEERIFMFLDLKDSTTHAENLGHHRFSRLIQECFHDLTESVIECEVEIYHYVGDEVILTWEVEKGLHNNNCVQFFFSFVRTLNKRQDFYKKNYAIMPQFKAGVNMGSVTVAEIGDIKRDISYLSEVLNTAESMQNKCNEFQEQLLISTRIKEQLTDDSTFNFYKYEGVELKGKEQPVEIYAVSINS